MISKNTLKTKAKGLFEDINLLFNSVYENIVVDRNPITQDSHLKNKSNIQFSSQNITDDIYKIELGFPFRYKNIEINDLYNTQNSRSVTNFLGFKSRKLDDISIKGTWSDDFFGWIKTTYGIIPAIDYDVLSNYIFNESGITLEDELKNRTSNLCVEEVNGLKLVSPSIESIIYK